MNPQKTTSGKWRIPKVVPLKCSGSWSAGLAAAAMRGTGGHPLLPGLAEVEGCRGPERLLFQLLVPSILSISDKLAATREKRPAAVIIYIYIYIPRLHMLLQSCCWMLLVYVTMFCHGCDQSSLHLMTLRIIKASPKSLAKPAEARHRWM